MYYKSPKCTRQTGFQPLQYRAADVSYLHRESERGRLGKNGNLCTEGQFDLFWESLVWQHPCQFAARRGANNIWARKRRGESHIWRDA